MTIDPVLKSHSTAMKIYNPNGPFVDGKLNFGPYEVWAVEKAKQSVQEGQTKQADTSQNYSFWLTDEWSRDWQTQCETTIQRGVADEDLGRLVRLNCEIVGADDLDKAYKWAVNLNGIHKGPNIRTGEIRSPRYEMRIESHYNDTDASQPAVGFDIFIGEKPVASVKTQGKNAIWIHDHLGGDARSAVAATVTGLMIFDQVLQKS
jgi:hypothetical protein